MLIDYILVKLSINFGFNFRGFVSQECGKSIKRQKQENQNLSGKSVLCRFCGLLVKNELFNIHEQKCKRKQKRMQSDKCISENDDHFVPHPTDREQCSKCNFRSDKLHKLKKHYREYHEKKTCPHCKKAYSFYFIDRHIKTAHTKDLQFQCEICSQRFYRERQLKHHIDEYHVKEMKYVCEVCGEGFYSQLLLSRHKSKRHNVSKFFPCQLCNKVYLSNGSLKKHKRRHHQSQSHLQLLSQSLQTRIC